jgi:hypothetical protein
LHHTEPAVELRGSSAGSPSLARAGDQRRPPLLVLYPHGEEAHMRWLIASLLLAASALAPAPTATAVGTCPDQFHLHTVGDGDHEHGEHRHAGLSMDKVDKNGNNLICVKHVGREGVIHVHIDDI